MKPNTPKKAIEDKKKVDEAKKKAIEAKKKIASAEKKVVESQSKVDEAKKKVDEAKKKVVEAKKNVAIVKAANITKNKDNITKKKGGSNGAMPPDQIGLVNNYIRSFHKIMARQDDEEDELPLSNANGRNVSDDEYREHRNQSLAISDKYMPEYQLNLAKHRESPGFDQSMIKAEQGWHFELYGT